MYDVRCTMYDFTILDCRLAISDYRNCSLIANLQSEICNEKTDVHPASNILHLFNAIFFFGVNKSLLN